MRVVVDGSALAQGPSGTRTYVEALVGAIARVAPEIDLRVIRPGWATIGGEAGPTRAERLVWELHGVRQAAVAAGANVLHVPSFAAPVRGGPPLVVTIHDVIPLVLPAYRATRAAQIRLAMAGRTVRRARRVLVPSEAARRDVEAVLGIPADRLRVTPEAAGPTFRPPRDGAERAAAAAVARRLGVAGPYIFHCGGFDARKNLPVLVEAFALARRQLDGPLSLVLAGAPHSANAAVYPDLGPVILAHGVEDGVILPGRVSEVDKVALYQAASAYATPSLHEGFGLPILEAMACGVPTIGSDRTSLPEVIGDGGLVVPPEAEAFAAAIVSVLSDPGLAARLGAAGIARAATFSWEETARQTVAAYREAAGMTCEASPLRPVVS